MYEVSLLLLLVLLSEVVIIITVIINQQLSLVIIIGFISYHYHDQITGRRKHREWFTGNYFGRSCNFVVDLQNDVLLFQQHMLVQRQPCPRRRRKTSGSTPRRWARRAAPRTGRRPPTGSRRGTNETRFPFSDIYIYIYIHTYIMHIYIYIYIYTYYCYYVYC